MNIAAYCRVSTDKSDQLNSLETQKEFFLEYTKRTGDNLIKLYADEGISGTKIKNRMEFQRMLADAEKGLFDMVVVKDISRFARNTVDLLQSVRKLKSLGIETQFLTANMTSMGNSEFVLTIFGALAQEESANTSKRIKFGKKMNAEKGRVPNIVFGYDKTIGDYFNLSINENEAMAIRQIFQWYTEEGYGGSKIANMLNERGIKTKRGNNWSQNSVCRILTNEIYTGKIINGKEEIADFLTGQRKEKNESEWFVTIRPELRIIEDEVFDKAQDILKGRHDSFKITHERQSNKYLFSTLIKCKECGWSFRRTVRQYKNTYVRWVCSGHNGKGADSCPNAVTVDEEELIQALQEYFQEILSKKKKVINYVIKEFQRVYKAKDENIEYEKQLNAELNKLRKSREKYMDMYTDDLISREELNEKIGGMRKEIERLENELKMVSYHLTKGEQLEAILNSTFKQLEDITDVHEMTNAQLKRLIQKIEVDKEGNVDIYLRLIGDLGLDEAVLIEGTENSEENNDDSANKLNVNKMSSNIKTAPNRHDHT
ncbi:MAG: recombinase family protein [Roseburia intestinalis]|jgi:site-specific DNA recombinase|nr:recombinase family protein [Roseburia intestinalis]